MRAGLSDDAFSAVSTLTLPSRDFCCTHNAHVQNAPCDTAGPGRERYAQVGGLARLLSFILEDTTALATRAPP